MEVTPSLKSSSGGRVRPWHQQSRTRRYKKPPALSRGRRQPKCVWRDPFLLSCAFKPSASSLSFRSAGKGDCPLAQIRKMLSCATLPCRGVRAYKKPAGGSEDPSGGHGDEKCDLKQAFFTDFGKKRRFYRDKPGGVASLPRLATASARLIIS